VSETTPASGPACPECAAARTGGRPTPLLRRGAFLIHPRPEPAPVPGWLVVAPARHVEQIDALTSDEQRALGPLLAEVAGALRAETPCEKVYVSVFAEVLPHFHVHVIARPPGLPEEEVGPRLFASGRRADEAERAALFRRVSARLAANPTRPPAKGMMAGPWRAVLLSATVCPGVGQITQRRYVPGLALLGSSLALVAVLLVRVVREAVDRMPTDPVGLDPLFAFGLAAEIRQANASFFGWISAGLVLLWGIGIADAWLAQR
jgi:diadenosine tetraphosphate (Ap4A) HIT family hydrolase